MPRATKASKTPKASKATRPLTPAKPTKASKPRATPAGDSGPQSKLASDFLAAINSSELSRYEIARRAEISAAALSYFVNGQRSLTLESAGRIADVLGLELRPAKR